MDGTTSTKRRTAAGCAAMAGGAFAALVGLGGCRTAAEAPPGRPVDLQAFVIAPAAGAEGDLASEGAAVADATGAATAPDEDPAGGRRTALGAGTIRPPRLIGAGDDAPPAAADGAPPGVPVGPRREVEAGDTFVIDALVGQINGRPIFAGEFFEPLASRLRAIGLSVDTQTAFVQQAAPIIQDTLARRVEDALYLAEAEAALTPEERQGLRFWLAEIRDVTVAQRGGSRAEADRRLRETENRTLEEEIEEQRNVGLQRKLIQEKILPRIIVSRYDIEREYQRRFDEFNPPPRTRVDRLIVRRTDTDVVAEVTERLEAGESIRRIAEELAAAGRAQVSELGVFGVRPDQLSESEQVAEVLRGFAADWTTLGDWTGPIETSRVSWFYVGEVRQEPGRPSYDENVQRMLKAELRNRKLMEELARFKARLRQESIISQEQEMLETLLEIAVRRYGPR